MAPHFSTLAWKIPWTEEPGGLQSMGSLESDTTERLPFHFSLSWIGEGYGNPLQCSCLENPRDRGACWAAVYGVAQSRTRLTRLSSSSSISWTLLLLGGRRCAKCSPTYSYNNPTRTAVLSLAFSGWRVWDSEMWRSLPMHTQQVVGLNVFYFYLGVKCRGFLPQTLQAMCSDTICTIYDRVNG